MNQPRIVSIVVNWNREQDTYNCINSLEQQEYANHLIIIIDNGSDNNCYIKLKELTKTKDNILLYRNKINMGYAKGANKGIEIAMKKKPHYILLINNDAILEKNSLLNMINEITTDDNIGFVTGKIYYYGTKRLQSVGKTFSICKGIMTHIGGGEIDNGQYNIKQDRQWIDHVFVLINVKLIQEIGCYDEDFYMYYEDADWCIRARRKGYILRYIPNALAWHKISLSSGGWVNPSNTYYMERNIYYYIKKWATTNETYCFFIFQYSIGIIIKIAILLKEGNKSLIKSTLNGIKNGLIKFIT